MRSVPTPDWRAWAGRKAGHNKARARPPAPRPARGWRHFGRHAAVQQMHRQSDRRPLEGLGAWSQPLHRDRMPIHPVSAQAFPPVPARGAAGNARWSTGTGGCVALRTAPFVGRQTAPAHRLPRGSITSHDLSSRRASPWSAKVVRAPPMRVNSGCRRYRRHELVGTDASARPRRQLGERHSLPRPYPGPLWFDPRLT
jgi:hypothetical protein